MDGYDVEFWTLLNGPYSAYNFLKMVQCEHNISVLFPVNHCVLIRRQQQQLWISCMKHFFKNKNCISFNIKQHKTSPVTTRHGSGNVARGHILGWLRDYQVKDSATICTPEPHSHLQPRGRGEININYTSYGYRVHFFCQSVIKMKYKLTY